MPRPLRFVIPDIPHHVTQRGNYRQSTFLEDAKYRLYLRLLREYSRRFQVSVQAYCLMPNHVHLILTPPNGESLPRLCSGCTPTTPARCTSTAGESGTSGRRDTIPPPWTIGIFGKPWYTSSRI